MSQPNSAICCSECGAANSNGARFCNNCWQPLPQPQSTIAGRKACSTNSGALLWIGGTVAVLVLLSVCGIGVWSIYQKSPRAQTISPIVQNTSTDTPVVTMPTVPQNITTHSLGNDATIEYPKDWYVYDRNGIVFLSPDAGTPEDSTPRPIFTIFYDMKQLSIDLTSPDDILAQLVTAIDLHLDSGSYTHTLNDIAWTQATFEGPFGDFRTDMKGWIAVCHNMKISILAAAPSGYWDEYESTFATMLHSLKYK